VAAAAESAEVIAATIADVADATGATTRAMGDARTAIAEVARMAAGLASSVSRFRY
jgi:methyl-accepting chemotaxis protein